MPISSSSIAEAACANLERVRRQARALLREARSEQLSHCLPALRRLQGAGLFGEWSLVALAARRQQVRLKHCLRALAAEYGFSSWEALKPAAAELPELLLDRDRLHAPAGASLHLWFGSLDEARAYVREHGGRSVAVGRHAAVIPAGLEAR